jgi:hypothetical protein
MNPVINCENSIMILNSAPITTIFFMRKFVMNGSPKPKGIRSRMFRNEVFISCGVSVISGIRFTSFPTACPFRIRSGIKYFRRIRD